jgi:hypothetical protein
MRMGADLHKYPTVEWHAAQLIAVRTRLNMTGLTHESATRPCLVFDLSLTRCLTRSEGLHDPLLLVNIG